MRNSHIIEDGILRNNRNAQMADLKIITTFDQRPEPTLIDITVAFTHAISNHTRTIIGANGDRYFSKLDHDVHKK